MGNLDTTRAQIDAIDKKMAALFEERMAAVQMVATYKKEHNLAVFDPAREEQILQKNESFLKNADLASYYDDFIRQLMRLSREYQTQLLGRGTVAYQGAEGGFGHLAAQALFPHAKTIVKATFADIFHAVENEEVSFGIVPFENSSTGDVSGVLDLCYRHHCSIITMFDLPIMQNLLGLPCANLGTIKAVYSHVQALEQSKRFLDSLGVQVFPCENTALAAQYVANQKDPSLAAVGSLTAGALYGLIPLAKDISNGADNATRFAVLSKHPALSGNRFSLLITVENGVGRLAKVIEIIAKQGFDMENIKSRPMPQRPWEYYFYIELVGQARSEEAAQLLKKLADVCLSVRLLGIYNRTAVPDKT